MLLKKLIVLPNKQILGIGHTPYPERPLGILPVVVFNLGRGGVPWGSPVAGQLSGTPLCTGLTHLTLRVPVLGSRV